MLTAAETTVHNVNGIVTNCQSSNSFRMSGGNQYKKKKVTAKQTQKTLNLTTGGIKQILTVAQNLILFTE